MKKVIYPGPAIPLSMAESGYYPVHGITLIKGENELEDAVADTLLANGHVRVPEAPQAPASEVAAPRIRRPGPVEGEN